MRRPAATVALVAVLVGTPVVASAQPVVEPRCAPTDEQLSELSGLASDGQRWYAAPDGGDRLRVWVLDPATCATVDVIENDVDPFDVEDLALAPDGALWLADTGDNDGDRQTVALHRLAPDGGASLYRLTYPDGRHDAEALLLDRAGVAHIVTKQAGGSAGVYRPAGPLDAAAPTPLERVASVRVSGTDTPGGPVGRLGSTLLTGGAVSQDGTVVALRTYTDVYLYPAPDGDVVAALDREPRRIPLPDEPQGEAVAFEPDGTLLSASEELAPIRAIPGAAASVGAETTADPAPAPDGGAGPADPDDGWAGLAMLPAAALAIGIVGGVAVLLGLIRRTRR